MNFQSTDSMLDTELAFASSKETVGTGVGDLSMWKIRFLDEDMIVIPFTSCPFFFLIWIVKVLPDEKGLDTVAESLQAIIQELLL